jgi:hypothetical protein
MAERVVYDSVVEFFLRIGGSRAEARDSISSAFNLVEGDKYSRVVYANTAKVERVAKLESAGLSLSKR